MAVLKVFEGGFRVFKRCFCMAYLQRMGNITLGYIRFGVIFGGFMFFFVFVFKGVCMVLLGFKSFGGYLRFS